MKIYREPKVGTIFDNKEINAIKKVLDSGDILTRGKEVELFEKDFAKYCGAKYAVALSSCGAGLKISSQLLNLKPGDEIICQANSFWVTINHLIEKKIKIKCADIDPETLNIDPNCIKKLITKKTRAIYIVHLGGNSADLDAIKKIIAKKKITLVEDAAHALGTEYKNKKIGYNSEMAIFSFSSSKTISTLGEGGMFVTNNAKFAEQVKLLRTNFPIGSKKIRKSKRLGKHIKPKDGEDFGDARLRGLGKEVKPKGLDFLRMGDSWDYDWTFLDAMGSTYRLSTVQAAVGRIQMKKLNFLLLKRKKIAEKFNKIITKVPQLKILKILPRTKNSWWIYNFFIDKKCKVSRDEFASYLFEKFKVQIVLRFSPINMNGVMRMRGSKPGDCPKAEASWFYEQLSLPLAPNITIKETNYIINAVKKTSEHFFGKINI